MINFDDGIDNLDLSDELEWLACNENFKLPFRLIGPSDDEGPKIIVDADYVDLVRIPYGAPPMRNVVGQIVDYVNNKFHMQAPPDFTEVVDEPDTDDVIEVEVEGVAPGVAGAADDDAIAALNGIRRSLGQMSDLAEKISDIEDQIKKAQESVDSTQLDVTNSTTDAIDAWNVYVNARNVLANDVAIHRSAVARLLDLSAHASVLREEYKIIADSI